MTDIKVTDDKFVVPDYTGFYSEVRQNIKTVNKLPKK